MPYQHQSNELAIVAGAHPVPHESNLVSTQLITNTTEIENSTIHNSFSSSHHQTPPSPNNLVLYNNQFGCRAILASKKITCSTKADYFKVLYCMYSGCEGTARNRINALLQNKHSTVTIRSIKPLKKEYVTELIRRHSYLMLKEKGVLGFNKKIFRPANKSQDELNTFFNSGHFQLPTGEKLYLEFEMEQYLNHYENELQIRLDELMQLGSEISKTDLRKMRLWEALFIDSQYMRDKLVTLKHSLSREQIDARNSQARPISLFQLVAEKYNDENWVVLSRVLPDLNEKFRRPIRLVLMPGEEEMTESSVKNAYTDVKGKLNFAMSNWKTSGNGKGNLNPKLKGLEYDRTNDETIDITYVDDDRFSFVSQLHVVYFWSLSEITGLTQCISQNCSSLNMGITEIDVKNRSSTSGKAVGRGGTSSLGSSG